jgi:predicted small integral membrane protein
MRRSFLASLNLLGLFLSLSVIVVAPLAIKLIAAISIITHVFSINREYGFISHLISRDPNGPEGQY